MDMSGNDLQNLAFAGTFPSPKVENEVMLTGHWRSLRPVVDAEKCTQCLTCWIACPDACIAPSADGAVEINLKYCKGCGICTHVCPVGAVTNEPELEYEAKSGKEGA
jgi:2-oxoacid:acceptor oxidoreductase delta subunit (pyruvate/2-ketoisovalerate family)